jgi:hypothetical protein
MKLKITLILLCLSLALSEIIFEHAELCYYQTIKSSECAPFKLVKDNYNNIILHKPDGVEKVFSIRNMIDSFSINMHNFKMIQEIVDNIKKHFRCQVGKEKLYDRYQNFETFSAKGESFQFAMDGRVICVVDNDKKAGVIMTKHPAYALISSGGISLKLEGLSNGPVDVSGSSGVVEDILNLSGATWPYDLPQFEESKDWRILYQRHHQKIAVGPKGKETQINLWSYVYPFQGLGFGLVHGDAHQAVSEVLINKVKNKGQFNIAINGKGVGSCDNDNYNLLVSFLKSLRYDRNQVQVIQKEVDK